MDSTPSRTVAELDDRLAHLGIAGYWKLMDVARPEPEPRGEAFLWRWQDVRPLLFEASGAIGLGADAERRSLRLCPPPAMKPTTATITGALQMMLPGEVAPAHRHSPAALRFVIEGEGGHTTVNGERCVMAPADLVLTPQGSWHDHGNLAREPVIWLDVLDASFVRTINAAFYEAHNSDTQDAVRETGWSRRRAAPLRASSFVTPRGGFPYHYKGADSLALLAAAAEEGDPRDGVTLDFLNPLDGGPTLPTIQCHLSRLAAGRATRTRRHTWNVIYHVVSGQGETEAGGKILRWGPHDTFVVHSWCWHAHRAVSDAVLFSATDEPILKAFDLDRMEARN